MQIAEKCNQLIRRRKSISQTELNCSYYSEGNFHNFASINRNFVTKVWDIEDACAFDRASKLCPYFGLKYLQKDADIINCPYNYLLDPSVRQMMNIKLDDAVIVFDEGHNIEDICRDSASFRIDTVEIGRLIESINISTTQMLTDS